MLNQLIMLVNVHIRYPFQDTFTQNTKKRPQTVGKLRTQSNHQVLQYGECLCSQEVTRHLFWGNLI